jgi:hypothetical protein
MAKFFGEIGYGESVESPLGSGVWIDQIVEFSYFGDVKRNTRKLEDGESLNSNISVGNSISVIADQYAVEHFFAIRYIRWMGTLWTVTDVEVKSPRLIFRLGNVYNGEVALVPSPIQTIITDNLDGTWTAEGSDENILLDPPQFTIISNNIVYLDDSTFTISSDET